MIPTALRVALGLAVIVVTMSPAVACTDFSTAPDSRWRTEMDDGVAWLITPCGDRFFSVGVNVVDGGSQLHDRRAAGYHWASFRPSLAAWARSAQQQLHGWGFNTAGAWSLPPDVLDLPSTIELSLGSRVSFVWGDPFHPGLPARVNAIARRLIAPYKGDARRIGYFSDNEIGWWNGPLFVVYTRSAPTNHTKRRLVRLLRDRYRDEWEAFERDFVAPANVRSFDDLLRETRTTTRLRPGGEGFGAIRAWTALVADRYYRVMRDAIRAADRDALYLGDRLPIYYDIDAVRVMGHYVDVISTNYNADGPDGWIARYYFQALQQLTSRPVLVTEWFFAAHENRTGNLNRTGFPKTARRAIRPSHNVNRTGHLMTVATQDERTIGAAAAAEALAREPGVVGIHWFQYYDHPRGGRADGEDYNFGLVDVHDQPYDALVTTFGRVNRMLPRLHAEQPMARGVPRTIAVPYAAIDARDSALTDWPKRAALLPLRGSPDDAVFGDVYLSWDDAAMNVAVIAMDFYDANLMVSKGSFPPSEAFQVELGLRHGGAAWRIRLRVIPEPAAGAGAKPDFRIEACRIEAATCSPIAITTRFFGVAMDQPRMIFEAKLAWDELGGRPVPGDDLGLAVDVTSFYRVRWMSLSGERPGGGITSARWRSAVLSTPGSSTR